MNDKHEGLDRSTAEEKEINKMKDKIHEGEMFDIGNTKDISSLQEWQIRQNGSLNEIKECLKELTDKINKLQAEDMANLKLELARGKPSWSVLALITFFSSLAVGAIVYIFKTL